MVDFKKRLAGKKADKPIDPVKLYDTLDRAHDKGPLRPAQLSVLEDWFKHHRPKRDVIVKLHTGQGKTLIGLLMLQARLNDSKGPAVYLCPDNFLIDQTCEQARQFGISTCKADPELPDDFLNSEKILVTSVQKLFNGLTKFGLNRRSVKVGTLLMDDAHANDKRDALLPVPYWAWIGREADVASILSTSTDRNSVKFAWPLLKDVLSNCQCVISGTAVEIEPYIPPLAAFGSYADVPHRIFMSATVTDDAFLVKGLQLAPETISEPLTYSKERWSGEKMVLLPSMIHEDLDRGFVVKAFGAPNDKRRGGAYFWVYAHEGLGGVWGARRQQGYAGSSD